MGQDGYGNEVLNFIDRFTVWARMMPLKGGETVMAGRLAGRQPYVANVLSSMDTRKITTDWRAVDARNLAKVWNIRTVINVDEKDRELDLLVEEGVAT